MTRPATALIYAAVFVTAAAAAFLVAPHAVEATRSIQKDNFYQYSNYYMHQWLITEEDYSTECCLFNRYYRNGMDSRYSWGGTWHNMNQLGMVPARAWVCGSLYWYRNVTYYNTAYHGADSPWTGWTSCGRQADFQARFYKAYVVDWWPYLNF